MNPNPSRIELEEIHQETVVAKLQGKTIVVESQAALYQTSDKPSSPAKQSSGPAFD